MNALICTVSALIVFASVDLVYHDSPASRIIYVSLGSLFYGSYLTYDIQEIMDRNKNKF